MPSVLPNILNLNSLPRQYVALSLWSAVALSEDIGALYLPIEADGCAYPVRWVTPEPTLLDEKPDKSVLFRLRYENAQGKCVEVLRDGRAGVLLYLYPHNFVRIRGRALWRLILFTMRRCWR